MRIGASKSLGELCQARELPVLDDTIRDAQAAHIGLLRRRAVEQAEEAPAEIVVGFRRLVFGSLLLQSFIAIERMLLAFELLRVRQLAARLDETVLRAQMRRIWSHRFGGSVRRLGRSPRGTVAGCPARCLCDLQAGHEAFQIALLFGLKITRHCVSIHPWRVRCRPPRLIPRRPATAWPRVQGRRPAAAYRSCRSQDP